MLFWLLIWWLCLWGDLWLDWLSFENLFTTTVPLFAWHCFSGLKFLDSLCHFLFDFLMSLLGDVGARSKGCAGKSFMLIQAGLVLVEDHKVSNFICFFANQFDLPVVLGRLLVHFIWSWHRLCFFSFSLNYLYYNWE